MFTVNLIDQNQEQIRSEHLEEVQKVCFTDEKKNFNVLVIVFKQCTYTAAEYTLNTVQHTLYTVQHTLYTVQYTLYTSKHLM